MMMMMVVVVMGTALADVSWDDVLKKKDFVL
jgi:hypothetical protein